MIMTTASFLVAAMTTGLALDMASAFSTSSSPSINNSVPPVPTPPWYSDSSIDRDRSHVIPADRGFDYRRLGDNGNDDGGNSIVGLSPTMLDVLKQPTTRIIPFEGNQVFVRQIAEGENENEKNDKRVAPLCLLYDDCDPSWFRGDDGDEEEGAIISWLGRQSVNDGDYDDDDDDNGAATSEQITDYFAMDIMERSVPMLADNTIEASTVRNYGDSMPSRTHAALLASANGLLTFHQTHRFCSKCGSPTRQIKAGSARKCTNEECRTSVYPRIDPAVIMLITSPCGEYALLGRKKSWPSGRYSTLAGFTEVGETLDECVIRETHEESGVNVDPDSIQFVASQPWPFPKSLMLGYLGTAVTPPGMGVSDLPDIAVDPLELEDAKWFSKEFVRTNGLVEGRGSSALDFEPDEMEAEFHVPGPASLARLLITKWVTTTGRM